MFEAEQQDDHSRIVEPVLFETDVTEPRARPKASVRQEPAADQLSVPPTRLPASRAAIRLSLATPEANGCRAEHRILSRQRPVAFF
eukprot:COSAG02_NODE_40_length_47766_cov_88.053119_21_plen_86_part_00